jgi:hypothetical protein
MQKVLVDGDQLVIQNLVEVQNDVSVTFHSEYLLFCSTGAV